MPKVSCPKCSKEKNQTIAGSLTQFLLGNAVCECQTARKMANAKHDLAYCSRCAKKIRTGVKASLTAFLQGQSYCCCARTVMVGKTNTLLSATQTSGGNAAREAVILRAQLQQELETSHTLSDTYRLVELLGEGGMSYVYLAEHVRLHRMVAVKLMKTDLEIENSEKLFAEEARRLVSLSHPCLTQILDFAVHKGKWPLLAMELIKGETLADRMERLGPLEVDEALSLFKQVAEGLAYIHLKALVHKDLKPGNIMLANTIDGQSSSKTEVKILDFGISQLIMHGDTEASKDHLPKVSNLGSPSYMSPEEWKREKITPRTDLYAFGCSLYEALTGHAPYDADTIEEIRKKHLLAPYPGLTTNSINGNFNLDLDLLIKKLLSKSPEERYRSAQEVINALDELQKKRLAKLASSKVEAVPSAKFKKSKPIALLLLAASLTLGGSLCAVLVYPKYQSSSLVDKISGSDSKGQLSVDLKKEFIFLPRFDSVDLPNHPTGVKKERAPLQSVKVSQTGQKYSIEIPKGVFLGTFRQSGGFSGLVGEFRNDLVIDASKGKISWSVNRDMRNILRDSEEASFENEQYAKFVQSLAILPIVAVSGHGPTDDGDLRAIFCIPSLGSVTWSNINSCQPDKLGALKNLRSLTLIRTGSLLQSETANSQHLSGDEIATLKNLLNLEFLKVSALGDLTSLLERLKGSKNLQHLILENSNLTDRNCEQIAKIKQLKVLSLTKVQVSKSGLLSLLNQVKVETLEFYPVSEQHLQAFTELNSGHKIKNVYLAQGWLSEAKYYYLVQALKRKHIRVRELTDNYDNELRMNDVVGL